MQCTITETKTFYNSTELIEIEAPETGIVYTDHDDITIVPQVVHVGRNTVMAIRHHKLVTVQAGEVVGIVMPFTGEPIKRRGRNG